MTHQLKNIDQFQKELLVELNKEELKSYIDRTESRLGQEMQVDGFRKGKAPKDQVRKQLDPGAVLESALDTAVRDSLARVIEAEDLEVMNFSNLEVKENKPEKLVYSVTLSLYPQVDVKGLADFKVNKKDVLAEQKEIDETINSIKSSRAKFTDKEGPADNGDRVEVDFEITAGGAVIDDGISKNHPVVLGQNRFIPGFEQNLLGMKSGEEKTFSLAVPSDYYRKDLAGKKLDFIVKVNKVQTVEMPELNDDFAKSLGKFQDTQDLIKNISEGITQEKKIKEKQRVRLEILEHIIKTSNVSVPAFMVEKQLDSMVRDFDENLHANGMELGLYLAHIGKTQEELRKDWQKEAEKQVQIFVVLHKIAKDKNISASTEEIDQELNLLIQSIVMRGGMPQENINIEALRENIASKIINEKTLEMLEQTCAA